MNAYDFDNTIYDGESVVDFFLFCLKKDIFLIRYFPIIAIYLIKYKLNMLKIEKMTKVIEKFSVSFFKHNKLDEKTVIKEFWNKNYIKLKPQFLELLKPEDLIITGCPNFLLDYVKDELKTKNIICTEYDLKHKKLKFLCFGENKVIAFNEKYKGKKIANFYTDSYSDIPLMKLSNKSYFVKKNKIILIPKTKYIK